ncbi:MAG: threonine--tRNA ligase [Alphaproteobacteria bacterium]
MIKITLPDDSVREIESPITGLAFAETIAISLAKAAIALKIDGELADLKTLITQDVRVEILTLKSNDALEIIRHGAAHVMAEAVQELFPETQVTIGPAIENGFYYDFYREASFVPEDLVKIEKRMAEIIDRKEEIVREEWDRDEAIAFFEKKGEKYKAEIIADIPADQKISLYRQGDFIDLCRGPHLPHTGKLPKAFKLTKLAGAYWRGDSKNVMLQRIYGTAWDTEKALNAYLTMLEEAEKRDHRKLGKDLDLFHFQQEAPGAVFWHPKGWTIFRKLIDYMRTRQEQADYTEISTPSLMDRSLWETSGHWEKFRENMYTSETEDGRVFAIKPMNCPGGIQVFKQGITSYKDLPQRVAEFGQVNRYEASGALHGLMRVREFTQDDAHIFCTPEQLEDECLTVIDLIMDIYKKLGFEDVRIKFSDRPEKRIGTDETWTFLEDALKSTLDKKGFDYTHNPGEGAFYGPKLEFVLKDCIGRDWQCGTLQVDMSLPERFDVSYVGDDGEKHRPVMLHRALFGSLERFFGILTEHYAGKYPFWLAPIQVAVATITNDVDDYAADVVAGLKAAGLLVVLDDRNEKISYKIRELSLQKTPVILVIGKNEAAEKKVTLRRLGEKEQEVLELDAAILTLKQDAKIPL